LEQSAIKKFYTVLGTMARISKVCVLRLTGDHLYFILTDVSAGGSPSVWCEMRQESYFNEYNIEGVSKEHNEILMEIVPDKLSKTLVSLKSATAPARSVKVKLTKKTVPCLTFEVELPGNDQPPQGCVSMTSPSLSWAAMSSRTTRSPPCHPLTCPSACQTRASLNT